LGPSASATRSRKGFDLEQDAIAWLTEYLAEEEELITA
jgi:hypothetical protein